MAFSESDISDVVASVDDADLLVTWTNSAPGSPVQVYLDQRLAWRGYAARCRLPLPPGPVRIDVGTVLPGEVGTSFASSLPAPPGTGNRASLSWLGGTYLAADIAGFRVYGSDVAGGPVDLTKILATVPAYTGAPLDGFGLGGFGQGGFGLAASSYSWVSSPLGPGVWSFEVKAVDQAGNPSGGITTTVTIAGPPNPPAPFADGLRLHKTSYNAGAKTVSLAWNASP